MASILSILKRKQRSPAADIYKSFETGKTPAENGRGLFNRVSVPG